MSDPTDHPDLVSRLIDYESGYTDSEEEVVDFFQELINTGLAWTLQGSYGRAAQALIDAGHCHPKE